MRYTIGTVKLGVRSVLSEAALDKLQRRTDTASVRHVKLAIIAEDIPHIEEIAGQFFYSLKDTLEAVTSLFLICGENNGLILLMVGHLFSTFTYGLADSTYFF